MTYDADLLAKKIAQIIIDRKSISNDDLDNFIQVCEVAKELLRPSITRSKIKPKPELHETMATVAEAIVNPFSLLRDED